MPALAWRGCGDEVMRRRRHRPRSSAFRRRAATACAESYACSVVIRAHDRVRRCSLVICVHDPCSFASAIASRHSRPKRLCAFRIVNARLCTDGSRPYEPLRRKKRATLIGLAAHLASSSLHSLRTRQSLEQSRRPIRFIGHALCRYPFAEGPKQVPLLVRARRLLVPTRSVHQPAMDGATDAVEPSNVHVTGLDDTLLNEVDLRRFAEASGVVVSSKIIRDRLGVAHGTGFVRFAEPAHALRFISAAAKRGFGAALAKVRDAHAVHRLISQVSYKSALGGLQDFSTTNLCASALAWRSVIRQTSPICRDTGSRTTSSPNFSRRRTSFALSGSSTSATDPASTPPRARAVHPGASASPGSTRGRWPRAPSRGSTACSSRARRCRCRSASPTRPPSAPTSRCS